MNFYFSMYSKITKLLLKVRFFELASKGVLYFYRSVLVIMKWTMAI